MNIYALVIRPFLNLLPAEFAKKLTLFGLDLLHKMGLLEIIVRGSWLLWVIYGIVMVLMLMYPLIFVPYITIGIAFTVLINKSVPEKLPVEFNGLASIFWVGILLMPLNAKLK